MSETITIVYARDRSVTYPIGVFVDESPLPALRLDGIFGIIHGRAACGGPHLDVTFNATNAGGRKAQRMVVRVAVDASWRGANEDNHGLLLNCYGDAIL